MVALSARREALVCVYESWMLYVDQSYNLSRSDPVRFASTCKKAFRHRDYLIIVCEDLIEIRQARDGQLVQMIEGEDVNAWP